MKLFINTDTTGFIKDRETNDSPNQPYMTRLTLRLFSDEYEPLGLYDALTLPEGWIIPDEVTKINGISTELSEKAGVRAGVSGVILQDFMKQADTVVAFNLPFHKRVLEILFSRLNKPLSFEGKKLYCASQIVTPIVQLPPTQRMIDSGMGNEYKNPTMDQAYNFFFQENKPHNLLSVDAVKNIMQEVELHYGVEYVKEFSDKKEEEKVVSYHNENGSLRFKRRF